ncbi:hypothetical protein TNCT_350891 [Trichonephila clavata]|uniref:Uncharacterized protein n=1 Tax=Trichonephila clavata TaxID=2740835 RepID=A0A8X6LIZ3_TRICU|nr:hypothetical protein TNCT_350891 [Trichonephila clavata]
MCHIFGGDPLEYDSGFAICDRGLLDIGTNGLYTQLLFCPVGDTPSDFFSLPPVCRGDGVCVEAISIPEFCNPQETNSCHSDRVDNGYSLVCSSSAPIDPSAPLSCQI